MEDFKEFRKNTMKRYVIEFGTGVDLHGVNMTAAAKRAVKDAVSHCCLSGLHEILGLDLKSEDILIKVLVGVPAPEQVNKQELIKMIPIGRAVINMTKGGLLVSGIEVEEFGEGNQIIIANAAVTVLVNVN